MGSNLDALPTVTALLWSCNSPSQYGISQLTNEDIEPTDRTSLGAYAGTKATDVDTRDCSSQKLISAKGTKMGHILSKLPKYGFVAFAINIDDIPTKHATISADKCPPARMTRM